MKVFFYKKGSDIEAHPLINEMRKLGIEVVFEPDDTCDFMWSDSIDYKPPQRLARQFPKMKLIIYCWDYYEWAIKRPRKWEWDWPGYGEFLKEAFEVWVPNEGTKKRLKEYFNLDAHIIHTGIPVYEHETTDKRYVLNHLREYPEVNWGITKRACEELGIPYVWTDHQLPEDEWHKVVSECAFMVCEYYEASTGGLTLLEGLWNGKPALVAKSPYQGGVEYLGPFGNYFQWDNYEEFKQKLKEMWENPPKIDVVKARQYITEGFSFRSMAQKIFERINYLKNI